MGICGCRALDMAKDFNSLSRDDNQVALPTGTAFSCTDATTSPQLSPLTVSTSATNLAIPSNAAEVILSAAADIQVSPTSGFTTYFTLAAGNLMSFPVARVDNIYIKAATGTTPLSFAFILV